MYLFSKSEIDLIEKAVSDYPSSESRGWNIRKNYTTLKDLNISSIVSSFCSTNRKIYQLSKGIDYGQSEAMIVGSAVHSIVERIYDRTLLSPKGTDDIQLSLHKLKEESKLTYLIWDGDKLQILRDLSSNDTEYELKVSEIKEMMKEIVDFEIERLLDPNLSREVQILDLERYVNGSSFSIRKGKIDVVFRYNKSIGIGDLKTGKTWNDNHDHKIQITVYAMLLEAEIKRKIDWGVLIFPYEYNYGSRNLRRSPLKDIFPISSELRMEALEKFDEIEDLLRSNFAPPLCYKCKTESVCLKEVS